MKRLLFGFFCMLFCGAAQSAQIVNVEYIHKLIEQEHGITVPYNTGLHDPTVAANMKYLLTTIDVANQMLSGESITDYGNSEYATTVATDTVATLEMVRNHVRNYKFFATTTPDTTSFSFTISASGVFHIDWGDGTRESYRKTNTTATTYSHEYADAGEYVIKIGGYRTGGNSLSFANNLNLAKIDGSVGAIFSTIKNKNGSVSNPSFSGLFNNCTNLTGTIPPDLFRGIYGQPVNQMFMNLFKGSKLIGTIPNNFFGDLYGVYTNYLFSNTFASCKKLTGTIPDKLFGNLYGQPKEYMFNRTFFDCYGLTGTIPNKLLGEPSGTPARYMFSGTFHGCSGLTGVIPENLFGEISGTPAASMFENTFTNCRNLIGTSAKMNGEYLYNIWPDTTYAAGMYRGCTGLTDYADIPTAWK